MKKHGSTRPIRMVIKLVILTLMLSSQYGFADAIKIAVFKDHYLTISQYMSANGCADINTVTLNDNQMLAEFLILCHALKSANYPLDLELVPYPVSKRAMQAINKNEVIASGFGIWSKEISAYKLDASSALLPPNEFTKGLYTTKALSQRLSNIKQVDLTEFITVANQNWQHDWNILRCTGMSVLHVNQYEQMFKMIKLGRADIVPLTFSSSPNMKRNPFNISLYPIYGFKITFPDSLHYAINTSSEAGRKLKDSLALGLAKMREQGLIKQIYQTLGITNPAVKSWKTLECQHNPPW